jgi:hypothetical protein
MDDVFDRCIYHTHLQKLSDYLIFFPLCWFRYTSHCGMRYKNDKQFVNTLYNNIIQRGASNKPVSDHADVIISNKIADILRTLCISSWKVSPISNKTTLQNVTRL